MVNFQRMVKETLKRQLGSDFKKYALIINEEKEGFTILIVNKLNANELTQIRIEQLEQFNERFFNGISHLKPTQ